MYVQPLRIKNAEHSSSKMHSKWIYYAYDQHLKWNVSGLALLFVKSDTHAWHDCILGTDKNGKPKAEILFIEGRVKFLKNGIASKNSAPYPSAFVFWRSK